MYCQIFSVGSYPPKIYQNLLCIDIQCFRSTFIVDPYLILYDIKTEIANRVKRTKENKQPEDKSYLQ